MSKNYFKKTLAGIFAVALVASAVPLAPFAPLLDSISITASADDYFYFDVNDDGTLTITGYDGTGGDVVIPSEIGGTPVTVIGEEAFHGTGIQTIVLNEGLKGIEARAFWESSITSVTFPKSLCYIGASAFYFCENLEYVRFLNSNCEMRYEDCFSPFIECENDYSGCFLKTVYCPTGSSEYYRADGFFDLDEGSCGAWTFVEESLIPDSTLRWSLDENGVMTISGNDEAFPECWVNDAAIEWCDKKDEVTEVVFDTPKLTKLGSAAFYGFKNLTSVKLPDTLTNIDVYAFCNCSALTEITIPASVTSIGDYAFCTCTSLPSVTIPASVESIGDYAFCTCTSLPSVTIPASVESIGDYAFCTCTSLPSVTIPASVESIGKSSFLCCTSLTEVKIPNSVTSISDTAFYGCGSLTEIKIPDSVKNIEYGAFGECSALTEITIPASVTSISDMAFFRCGSLTEITIPASVTSIGANAFGDCSALTEVTFECDDAVAIANFNSQGNSSIFNEYTKLETIYVPAGCADSYKNSDGYKAALGDYIDLIQEMPTAEAKGYSVSYNGDITINFHYLLSDSYKNGYVEFSDGTQVIASVSAFEVKDANGYYVFPISMPAKNMYDEITAQFYDANDAAIGNAVTFKMADYLSAVKGAAPNTGCADFVDSFLEYGAQAANYFNVSSAPTAQKYTDSDYNAVITALSDYENADMDDTFVGATLLLKSTPKLRLYYSETFTGAEQNELNKNLFYTEKEISPVKFGTEDLNGYYVYNYIYKAMNSDDSGLKALCAALYNMSEAIPAVG